MIFEPADDFDLYKMANSGQCFTAREEAPGTWRFITGEHTVRLTRRGAAVEADCTAAEWETVWRRYFDLDRNYAAVRRAVRPDDAVLQRCAAAGEGIRILRQDPWETTVTFILSQRKNIPAIRCSVEKLKRRFGRPVGEEMWAFPTPEALLRASDEALARCALGYRVPYVRDAADRAVSGALDFAALEREDDAGLLEKLETVRGVGRKVASCISLFAYGRVDCAPVDVWIRRMQETYYGGADPFAAYACHAGIYQQYLFYFAQQEKQAPAGGADVPLRRGKPKMTS